VAGLIGMVGLVNFPSPESAGCRMRLEIEGGLNRGNPRRRTGLGRGERWGWGDYDVYAGLCCKGTECMYSQSLSLISA